jgi:hypothetical protein
MSAADAIPADINVNIAISILFIFFHCPNQTIQSKNGTMVHSFGLKAIGSAGFAPSVVVFPLTVAFLSYSAREVVARTQNRTKSQ